MNAAKLDSLYPQHLATLMQRTDAVLQASGFDALVIHAGSAPTQFLDDQDYPFKVNPHFKAWVPVIDNPHCSLIHVPGERPRVLWYQPRDFWHKPAAQPDADWSRALEILPFAAPAEAAALWPGGERTAHVGPPAALEQVDPERRNPPELLRRLHHERAVKTGYELACMRLANRYAAQGHRAALDAFRGGASEYHAHMRYLVAAAHREEELPYNNIVAYNRNAAVLHYQFLEREAPPLLRSLLIDAGAQCRGYAADVTRSYAASPGAFADLIALVESTQQKLCAEITPGRDYREVHLTAHRLLGDALHAAGLITRPGEEAVALNLTSVFFPHGIGHLLGLQVHDVGGVVGERPDGHPYLRLTRMLEPGVVVTVEPGLYFIESLLEAARADERRAHINWPMVEALFPYGGIRIEDNVATTTGAPENLTRDAFAAPAVNAP